MSAAIELEGVWAYYNDTVVLENVDLTVQEGGNFLGIIGPNGGGKSTLLKVILGLIKPQKGTVKVFGKDPKDARRYIGYVPQYPAPNLDFPISVWEVVMTGRVGQKGLFKRYDETDRKAAYDALEKVDMLQYRDRQIGKLSGGQRQRVFIARSLVNNPKLLLLDEPATGIDSIAQKDFYELLNDLKSTIAIVMVSHDIGAVSIYVDKIACLNQKLYYHNSKELKTEDLERAYQCPVELIAHGMPHRVLKDHQG